MDSLRSALQPITHNLPTPIHDLGVSILGDVCYKTLLLDIDVTATECIKLAISKGLGIGIIGASSIVKVPQILKLLNSKSAEGVSFISYFLETAAYLISFAYNFRQGFPFSTYGESSLILVQNVVISALVLNYSGKSTAAGLFVTQLVATAVALFNPEIISMEKLSYMQVGAGVLGVASKVPQIAAIYREGGTGQLSAFAAMQEVDDKLILYATIGGFLLNAVLAGQMVYYWNAPTRKAKGKQREKIPVAATSGSTTATPKGKSPTTRRRG
ncbi:Mannose-P-dolichol utilization defect [Hyphodiscus hymeniophilus]|uniref:Solute carrier family 66 member 3 n=1 Tax=Hyphodiscus hymeniophilus TaxID=353542 RepID=A0A9P6SK45_9HELO|nr:Mannose-P-dolichol utilization defect [Hyphodiscus hymeniophilus]